MYKLIYVLLFTFIFFKGYSQDTKILTYEEAVNIALHESYTIKSYQETVLATQFSYLYYKAMFKPRLDLNLYTPAWDESISTVYQTNGLPVYNSYKSFKVGGDIKFTYVLPTGGNVALNSTMYRENLSAILADEEYTTLKTKQAYSLLGISFTQPILTKNTLKESLKEAEYQYKISTSSFTRQQMTIIYNVTEGFYGLYKATRVLEISEDKLKNSEEAYRIAKLKAETGRIPEGDLLIAEVAAAQNRAQFSENTGKLEKEKDIFKQLIGLDINQDIKIMTDIKYDTFQIDRAKAIEEALKNRLEINESEMEVKLQEIQMDRAKREREISGTISAYYDLTGISTIGEGSTEKLFQSSFDDFVKRPPNRGITLTVSIPIVDWGRGSSKVRKAKAELSNVELGRDDKHTTIVREVRDIVRTVEELRNRLKIHEKNQEVSQKSYQVSLLRFSNGDITSQELSVEQERLTDSQLTYLNAYIAYQLAVVDLKRKTTWDFQFNRSYLNEIKEDDTK
jgi:outer membrane protein